MTKSINACERRTSVVGILLAVVVVVMQATCSAAEAPIERGVLKGRFVYDGKPPKPELIDVTKEPECRKFNLTREHLLVDADGGLKNVIIFVVTKGVAPPSAKDANDVVVLKIDKCRFEPHVLPVLLSQTLEVHSDVPVERHNINLSDPSQNSASPQLPPYGTRQLKFSKARSAPVDASCSLHPWLHAYVLPRDNPYFAVSKDDGAFEIKDLPAGKKLEFQVWHEVARDFKKLERKGWTKGRFAFEIKPGDNDLGEIMFDEKLFER